MSKSEKVHKRAIIQSAFFTKMIKGISLFKGPLNDPENAVVLITYLRGCIFEPKSPQGLYQYRYFLIHTPDS